MANLLPTPQRFLTIRSRQEDARWGKEYEPSILATVREAPSVSIASRLYWARLERDIHCLSMPETAAALLALYNGNVFELHEQKMLSPEPRCHPLFGHPRAHGLSLPPLKGTVAVAERLGAFKFHPTVLMELRGGELGHVPFPWVGDLLLFMQDEVGPYCVNWNVKLKRGDHDKPFQARRRTSARSVAQAKARREIETMYYQDAGIATRDVSLDDIPHSLICNLACLFPSTKGHIGLPPQQQDKLIDIFSSDMRAGIAPMTTLDYLASSCGLDRAVVRKVLYRAIWSRRLRVDLYSTILMDKPLQPERTDALASFFRWFRR